MLSYMYQKSISKPIHMQSNKYECNSTSLMTYDASLTFKDSRNCKKKKISLNNVHVQILSNKTITLKRIVLRRMLLNHRHSCAQSPFAIELKYDCLIHPSHTRILGFGRIFLFIQCTKCSIQKQPLIYNIQFSHFLYHS